MKKVVTGAVLLLVIVVTGVGLYVARNLDRIVKDLVQTVGTEVAGTPVTLGSVDIALREGRATLRDLAVANPPGFSRQNLFVFEEITARAALGSDGVVIRDVTVRGPSVVVEQQGQTTNADVLLRSIESRVGPKPPADAPKSGAESVHLQIDRIRVEAAKGELVSDQLEKPVSVDLDAVEFRDLEGTPEEIARQVLRQFTAKLADAATAALIDAGVRTGREALRKEIERKVGDTLEDIDRALGGKVKGLF